MDRANDVPVVIYDKNMEPVADLKDAYDISYDKKLNKVGRASFSLPVDNKHYDKVQGMRFAELYDGDHRVGMYRIKRPKDNHDDSTFRCQHVLGTLMTDMLIGVHSGIVGTNDAIDYVLNQQDTVRWQKGTVDFSRNFHHRWEDKTLLYALFEIPDRYDEDYQWTFDTTTYPWTVNLVRPDTEPNGLIYYTKNAQDITREKDFSSVITKLYAFGAGAGSDQLELSDSSYTDQNYVEDDSYDYSVTRTWVDQRYEIADNLYEAAMAKLNRRKTPRVYYDATTVDMFRKTGFNELSIGDYVTVRDKERDLEVKVRIERLRKGDLTGKPSDIRLELANKLEPFPDFGNVAYADDLDQVQGGANFAKVYSTQVDAGKILLSEAKGGAVPDNPSTPDVAGLYLGAEYLGYHDGSEWVTYMDETGQLKMTRPDSGATVEILPNSNQGFLVRDDAGNPVLQALTGGTDIGDVILGNEATDSYAKYDKSADAFIMRGSFTADDLNGGTLDFNQLSRTGLEIIESEIFDGAVTKDKIDVESLSAISGDFGTITSGHAEFAGGDVQIGEGVLATGGDGILVKGGGGLEIEDSQGDVIFNSDHEFVGYGKHGSPQNEVYSDDVSEDWEVVDMSPTFGDHLAFVILRFYNASANNVDIWARQNNDYDMKMKGMTNVTRGTNVLRSDSKTSGYLSMTTDEHGKIEIRKGQSVYAHHDITLLGYILMG